MLVVPYAALATVPSAVWVTGLLAVASGLGLPPVLTCVFQLVDRMAPPGTTTEAFAWLISAFLVGSSVGAAVAGVLSDSGRIGEAFLVAAASSLVALAIARAVVRLGVEDPALRGASTPPAD